MVKQQQRRYEMFLKVRDFGAQHEDEFPASSAAGRAFAAVAEAAAAIEHQSSERLVRASRVAGVDEPPARDVFRLPQRRSDRALLDAAHAFIAEGEAASSRWVAFGLPETSIAELGEMATVFAEAIDSRRRGRTGVAAARKAVADALVRGFAAVRQLDVIVANTQASDSAIAAAWKQARRTGPALRGVAKEGALPVSVPMATEPEAPAEPPAAAPAPGDDELRRAS